MSEFVGPHRAHHAEVSADMKRRVEDEITYPSTESEILKWHNYRMTHGRKLNFKMTLDQYRSTRAPAAPVASSASPPEPLEAGEEVHMSATATSGMLCKPKLVNLNVREAKLVNERKATGKRKESESPSTTTTTPLHTPTQEASSQSHKKPKRCDCCRGS